MASTIKVIKNNLKMFYEDPIDGVSLAPNPDNFYEWDVTIIGPYDTLYEGGVFKAKLTFPESFPFKPPKFRFITPIYHPNIYENGLVCISILHEGEDEYGYEKSCERWTPVQSVWSIILSIITLFDSPNDESPANVDAGKDWRNYKNKVNKNFVKKVNECVKNSLK